MIIPGIVSVTFRQLEPAQIIELAQGADVQAVEWGADVHAPCGDLPAVRQVAQMSQDAGLELPVYGSYYALGRDDIDGFQRNLEASCLLGTPMIRIWAGRLPLVEVNDHLFGQMVDQAYRICELAQAVGVSVVPEWHGNSLLETTESACRFFSEVNHPSLVNFWQPHQDLSPELRRVDLERAALPRLRGFHVFQWSSGSLVRHALEDGRSEWMDYLTLAVRADRPLYALLEFVKNDDPQQFLADAKTLKKWVQEIFEDDAVLSC